MSSCLTVLYVSLSLCLFYSKTPMTPGALEAVHKLVHHRFQDRVYLVCVAAPQVQARMLRWLSGYVCARRPTPP